MMSLTALAMAAALLAQAPTGTAPTSPGPAAGIATTDAVPKPPAPAFRPGMAVVDTTGASIGVVQTMTEAQTGTMVVVKIEGTLVAIPASQLRLEGANVVSAQTKSQIVTSAAAAAAQP